MLIPFILLIKSTMNSINDRIKKIVDILYKGNTSAFAKAINSTQSTVVNITGVRQGKPGFDLIEKIINSIEVINLNWLLRGQGEMFDSNSKDYTKVSDSITKLEQMPNSIIELLKTQLAEKDNKIASLSEEIGVLKERIKVLQSENTSL